jgi:hypothetical protein
VIKWQQVGEMMGLQDIPQTWQEAVDYKEVLIQYARSLLAKS